MTHYPHLLLFFSIVFGIVALPGLDMAFVTGRSLTAGRRDGLAAVAGIIAGGICLVAMTTLGISALLKAIPGAFDALLLAGALYIAWIGFSLLKSRSAFGITTVRDARSWQTSFRQGALTCLMNPKAYLFMLAIFPQFLRPEYGSIWTQAMVLWSIIAITQAGVYGSMALMADRARRWLTTRPRAGLIAARTVGIVLILAAAATGFEGWRQAA